MRILVCRPQVPFARGGVEIFTDRLVDELRARDHDADLVTMPFKWYPGARVLTQAFLWRLADLTESDGRRVDMVVATKFPSYLVRHPEKRVWLVHQFRQAYELDGTSLGQFSQSPEDRALRRQVQELDRIALGEATPPLRHLAERRRPARALDRARRGGAAAPAAGARLPQRRRRRLRAVGQPARSREAHRPAARGGRPDARARGRRRGGRPRPRAARGHRPRPRPERPRALHRAASTRASLPGCMPAAWRRSTHPWTRTSAWARTRRSSPRSRSSRRPTPAGRSTSCTTGSTGLVVEPEAGAVAGALRRLHEHRDEAAALGGPGKAVAAEVTWDRAIARLLS